MSLSEKFYDKLNGNETNPEVGRKLAEMVFSAPETPESDGLLAFIYHEGIGVEADLDKSFGYAEKAALDGGDGLGYFILGYMCDNIETPNQEEGGPRQKYDQSDAVRFYEQCASTDSPWATQAHIWLGDYFLGMDRGSNPELAVEHYEAVADNNAYAASALCDYYWGFCDALPEDETDEELMKKVFHWTYKAYDLNPEDYAYQLGCVYEEGIGCKPSFAMAKKYFEEAYGYGDQLAADALVDILEDRLSRPGLTKSERMEYNEELAKWRKISNEQDGYNDEE